MDEEILVAEGEIEETQPPEFAFATVGAVYEDGVSLIFDGETEATEKHYKVNTSVVFHAGDRVKIASDAGTYVAEYVVGNPGATAPHELPSGGTANQALRKTSATDYDVNWKDVHELPSGGSAGQALTKSSGTDYAAQWTTINGMPAGGTTGQALRKSSNTDFSASWADVHELPSGGTANQVLRKTSNTNYSVSWADLHEIPSGGSAGQALVKKTGANYDVQWAEIVPAKILNQYNTGANYVIEFRTTSVYGTPVFQIRMGSGSWFTIATS